MALLGLWILWVVYPSSSAAQGLPALTIDDVSVAENVAGGKATFTITLSDVAAADVTVEYATGPDSDANTANATSGTDYAAASGTATITTGNTTTTVEVSVTDDTMYEPNEVFLVTLSSPSANAMLGTDAAGVGTITNDDPLPSVTVTAAYRVSGEMEDTDIADDYSPADAVLATANTTLEVPEASGGKTVTLKLALELSNPHHETVTVAWSMASGTGTAAATLHTDFGNGTTSSGSVSFTSGQTGSNGMKTLSIPIRDDNTYEGDETFTLTMSSDDTNLGEMGEVNTWTITEDESKPTVSVEALTVGEATATANVKVSLSHPSVETVTVTFSTSDDTATATEDYTAVTSQTVSFSALDTSETVAVSITNDALDEDNEKFNANLAGPTNATLGTASAKVTITDNDALPTVTVSGPTGAVAESGAVTFTVTLSPVSGREVSVAYAASAGSPAASTDDYTLAAGTATISKGSTTTTFTASITSDTIDEFDEKFVVTLSNPTSATLGTAKSVTVTVTDDDDPPELRVADETVDEDDGTLDFTVTLYDENGSQVESGKLVKVDYATTADTATAGTDYTTRSGTLNIAAGNETATVSVSITDDVIDEFDEEFDFTLTARTDGNATVSSTSGSATGTIIDNDDPPELRIADTTVTVSEGVSGGNARLTVTMHHATSGNRVASGKTVTVAYGTDDLSDSDLETMFDTLEDLAAHEHGAAVGDDYTDTGGTLSFSPGTTSLNIDVPITNDMLDEYNEVFALDLSSPTNASVDSDSDSAVVTITDNDATPSLSIDSPAVDEDVVGGNATLTVTLSAVSGRTATVRHATADLTAGQLGSLFSGLSTLARSEHGAKVGDDYTDTSGTLTFSPGTTSLTINVPITDDALDEYDEVFASDLSDPTNSTISTARGVATITDDDTPPEVSIDSPTVDEDNEDGDATLTVTLSAVSGRTVTVRHATKNLTEAELESRYPTLENLAAHEHGAAAGADYTTKSGTLTFSPGTTSLTVDVSITDDALDEYDEVFASDLSNPVNSTISTARGVATVTDDDDLPILSFENVTVGEHQGPARLTVALTPVSGRTVTVNHASADLTGAELAALFTDLSTLEQSEHGAANVDNTDYSTTSGTLTFSPGTISQRIEIPLTNDVLDEYDEVFASDLSAETNSEIMADGERAIVTITDDDPLPQIVVATEAVGEADGTLAFEVQLSAESGRTVTAQYASTDMTDDELEAATGFTGVKASEHGAVAGSDYTSTSGTLTYDPGDHGSDDELTVSVPVLVDALDEYDEVFHMGWTLTNAAVHDPTVGTITDDDDPPTLTVAGVSLNDPLPQAGEGDGEIVFGGTLSAVSGRSVSVHVRSRAATATPGGDFVAVNRRWVISPGNLTGNFPVSLVNDSRVETSEVVKLDLSSPEHVVLLGPMQVQGVVTLAPVESAEASGVIIDNDGAISLEVADVSVAEDAGQAVFTVQLVDLDPTDNLDPDPVMGTWATTDREATSPDDYTAATGSFSVSTGTPTATASVTIKTDTIPEDTETFGIVFTPESGQPVSATASIEDRSAPPVASIGPSSVSVREDTPSVNLTIALSFPSAREWTVGYITGNVTAVSWQDYVSTTDTISFARGETTRTVQVRLRDDEVVETDETFTVTLRNPRHPNVTLGSATTTVTIEDNDGLPKLSISPARGRENDSNPLVFKVTLEPESTSTVTVNYTTVDITATAGEDYEDTNGTLTFNAGDTEKTIEVPLTDDTVGEGTETFAVVLSSPTNSRVSLTEGTGRGTITDNERPPRRRTTTTTTTTTTTGGGGGGGGGERLPVRPLFSDVRPGIWYEQAVAWMVQNGVTRGCSLTMFCPDANMTRQQFVTFLWRAADEPAGPYSGSEAFTDVRPGVYSDQAIGWAVANGVTVGCTAGEFGDGNWRFCPGRPVTRGQMAALLYRHVESAYPGRPIYDDVSEGSYFSPAIAWLTDFQVVSGCSSNQFCPDRDATRAEGAAFISGVAIRPFMWGEGNDSFTPSPG